MWYSWENDLLLLCMYGLTLVLCCQVSMENKKEHRDFLVCQSKWLSRQKEREREWGRERSKKILSTIMNLQAYQKIEITIGTNHKRRQKTVKDTSTVNKQKSVKIRWCFYHFYLFFWMFLTFFLSQKKRNFLVAWDFIAILN